MNRELPHDYRTFLSLNALGAQAQQEYQHQSFNCPKLACLWPRPRQNAAQVALRFLEQQNIIPIPRMSKRERLAENLGSLDFARLILAEQLGRRIGELM